MQAIVRHRANEMMEVQLAGRGCLFQRNALRKGIAYGLGDLAYSLLAGDPLPAVMAAFRLFYSFATVFCSIGTLALMTWTFPEALPFRFKMPILLDPVPLRNKCRCFSVDDLMADATFAAALRDAALELLVIHRKAPRVVRYVADLQKWLLSQATLAMHFERKLNPSCPPITAANLAKFLVENRVASHNTAISHLKEMAHYKLFEPLEISDRRSNALQATAYTEQLIRQWFDGHLRSLDSMDAGDRHHRSEADPTILFRAQPRIARRLFHHPDWYSPPESIALFVKSESGSNILHDLISRAPPAPVVDGPLWIGAVSAPIIAAEYLISRSHAGRLLAAAHAKGLLGWEAAKKSGACWISAKLMLDYRRWQAVKFSVISEVVANI